MKYNLQRPIYYFMVLHGTKIDAFLSELKSQYAILDASWIPLSIPTTIDRYDAWISEGKHASMTYLKDHASLKREPTQLLPNAKSILLLTSSYLPHPKPKSIFPGLRIAKYAEGEDYHHWLKKLTDDVSFQIQNLVPGAICKAGTDAIPVLERDFAAKAGLGWIGKNTCLIHPKKGSFFFIAEVLTTVEINSTENPKPIHDFCGSCNRCIEICPTGALEKPRVLNANKCISYLTIESKTVPPAEFRKPMLDLFFGCDLCQSVCPWNGKLLKSLSAEDPPHPRLLSPEQRQQTVASLQWILTSSNRSLNDKIRESPLERARPFGLRRNAMVSAANLALHELKPYLEAWIPDERLGELAKWACHQLDNRPS